MGKLYFIVELGQNHQGSIKIAKQMIDELIGTGVSAVKTAKRDIDTCLTEEQKAMPYINPNSFGKNYYEHRKALELSHDDFQELKFYAELKGFDFISSFTDMPSFDFLKKIGLKKIKIASSRITDIKLLNHVAENYKDEIYMSSGMSTMEEIHRMITIFRKNKKYLLQCTAVYPCPNNLLNLNVITSSFMANFYSEVDGFGFSGHHAGIAPDIAAYMMGADIIERHFTLNRSWKGTDHAASLGIDGIRKIIKYINEIEDSLGDYSKNVLLEEYSAIEKLRGDIK
jgi:sialic acid synthase SpsE